MVQQCVFVLLVLCAKTAGGLRRTHTHGYVARMRHNLVLPHRTAAECQRKHDNGNAWERASQCFKKGSRGGSIRPRIEDKRRYHEYRSSSSMPDPITSGTSMYLCRAVGQSTLILRLLHSWQPPLDFRCARRVPESAELHMTSTLVFPLQVVVQTAF